MGSAVVAVCDKSPTARKRIHKSYPHIKVVAETAELMASTDVDAVAVVTPVWTHYELAKAALENGKHVFVEKPFTSDSAQAEELINLAARKESHHHGGSHLPLYRCGAQDSPTD